MNTEYEVGDDYREEDQSISKKKKKFSSASIASIARLDNSTIPLSSAYGRAGIVSSLKNIKTPSYPPKTQTQSSPVFHSDIKLLLSLLQIILLLTTSKKKKTPSFISSKMQYTAFLVSFFYLLATVLASPTIVEARDLMCGTQPYDPAKVC